MLATLPLCVFPLCMVAAAVSDIRKFIIPNVLSLVMIAGFALCFALSGLGLHALLNHLGTGFAVLSAGFALYAFGLWGAGDAKLLSSAALWLGWPTLSVALVYIAVLGGVLSVAILLAQVVARRAPALSLKYPRLADLAAQEKLIAPYGVAIAAGSLWAFPRSDLFQAFMVL